MEQIFPLIRGMTWEESRAYGLVNRGLMLKHETFSYRLSASTSDTIHIYKSSVVLYVLTFNTHLEYCCLDAFMGTEDEPIDSIFLQGSSLQKCIGNDWYSLPIATLATKLIQLFA